MCLLQQSLHSFKHSEDTHQAALGRKTLQGRLQYKKLYPLFAKKCFFLIIQMSLLQCISVILSPLICKKILHFDGSKLFTCHALYTGFICVSVWQCKHCGKAFASHAAHDSHVRRTHTKEKPCICTVCGKTFSQAYELKFHMNMHPQ